MMAKRIWLLFVSAIFLAPGCADEGVLYETEQAPLSGISDEHGLEIRSVMRKFTDSGVHNVNVATMASTISSECLRNFAGAFANESMVIGNQSLDLTGAGVLPKTDAFGDYDPTGGFLEFTEITTGALTGKEKETRAYKRVQEFTAGSVEDFDFTRTKDSPDGYSLHDREQISFKLASNLEYEETVWHQVVSFTEDGGEISDRGYAYNSQPSMLVTLSTGNRAMSLSATDDLLESGQGWSTTSIQQSDLELSGTLTLYKPKKFNAEANTNEAAEFEEDTSVEDGLEVMVSTVTTVDKATASGPTAELETTTEVVRTVTTMVKAEPATAVVQARVIFEETDDHTTSHVSYAVAPGQGAAALRAHAVENYKAHVVTDHKITTVETEYDGAGLGKYVRANTTTLYRYTDNPATRNDIAMWMSTRNVDVDTVDLGAGVQETAYGGTEWLTDQIQVDPEFDAVPFVWSGGTKVVTAADGHYFGADSSGFESSNVVETEYSVSAGFGSSAVEITGSYATRGSSISNGSGDAHSVQGDADGSLSLNVGDSSYTVSAEEWVGWISP